MNPKSRKSSSAGVNRSMQLPQGRGKCGRKGCQRPRREGGATCWNHWNQNLKSTTMQQRRNQELDQKNLCHDCEIRPTTDGCVTCTHCRNRKRVRRTASYRKAPVKKYSIGGFKITMNEDMCRVCAKRPPTPDRMTCLECRGETKSHEPLAEEDDVTEMY